MTETNDLRERLRAAIEGRADDVVETITVGGLRNIAAALDRLSTTEQALKVAEAALERVANDMIAFNAHPVGVIETWRELCRSALTTIQGITK